MLRIEEVKLTTGLSTDISPKAVDTQKNRILVNPILDALNARYIGNNDGKELLFESIKGNTKVINSGLPGGTNVQIGSFEDIRTNTLVYFVYNSGGSHGIYKYDPVAGTITTLIQNSLLNFQNNPRYLITGVGMQGDLLYWSDGYNPQRVINITRDYTGIASDKPITLIKEHPTTQMDVLSSTVLFFTPTPKGHSTFRLTDSNLIFNKIVDKNLQFSYQYIFIDNEKSVIAPISKLAYADLDPLDRITTISDNYIPVRVIVPSDILSFIKSVNLLVREGNTGVWSVFKKITNLSWNVINSVYNGYEPLEVVADAESAKIQESVPTISKALSVHKNRVVVSVDEENFDVNLVGGVFPLTLTLTQILETYKTPSESKNTYFKRGGARTFGVALFDARGRSMGVFGKTAIQFSAANDQNNVTGGFDTDTQRPYLQLDIAGTLAASPKAAYFSIVCTEEEYYEDYMQVPVGVLLYKYETPESGVAGGEIEYDSRCYYNNGFPVADATKFSHVHLLLPREAPFIPTDEYFVRLMSMRGTAPYSSAKLEKVIAVENSQWLVVNNFGITNYTYQPVMFAEIFKIRSVQTGQFYEISSRLPIVSGLPSQTSFTIYGDQYYVINQAFSFRQDFHSYNGVSATGHTASVETPTPTYGLNSNLAVYKEEKGTTTLSTSRHKILDQTRKDWNRGKVFVELPNPQQLDRSNVVRFSNQFLPDSSINGLSSFDSGDEYPLPVDRSRITKLVPIANNILAVHERTMTTLYVEQKMIKNASGAEQLVVTDRYIGFDNEIRKNKCGSYHPESIAKEDGGLVFGFDVFRGVVWQFSNEGISVISDFQRATYFSDKATALLPYLDTCKVLGGIDQEHTEYLISFVFPAGQESQNATLGFNWEKNQWTVRYDITPDGWAKIGQQLISFKDGELWVHYQNALYMNFYGVQYQRKLRVAVNPFPGISKNFMGLQIATNLLCSTSDAEFQCVKCYTEDGQETYMKADDFELLEGVYYGPVLKDVNTLPALIPAGKMALRDGDDMLGKYMEVELINNHTTDPCPIQFINVSYSDSQFSK